MEENTEEVQVNPEVENRAKTMGWIPKEEFKGDPEKWRPADEYVKRADEIVPIMRSQMGKYEEQIGQYKSEIMGLKSSLDSQKKTTEKLVKMSKTISERAYDQAKKDLTKQQAQAVSDGDVEKWQALEDQKEKLEKPEPVEIEKEPVVDNPVFDQWHQQNDWYLKDPDLTIYANGIAAETQRQNPSMPYDQILKMTETKVKEVFANKFENPNRDKPDVVDAPNVRITKPTEREKNYNDLPADAKMACDNVVEQNLMTKEEYIKEYFSEE